MKIKEIDYGISGIYKIIFNNNKLYIGLSNDVRRRMNEHIGRDLKEYPDLLISKAILKHGIKDVEIIEYIDSSNRELLKQREIYWINFYDTYKDRNKGYNMTLGGDGASTGIYNVSSKISEDELRNICNYLQHTNLSYEEIANLTNSSCKIISDINNGRHYYNSNLIYPLRNNRIEKYGIENKHSAFYNQEDKLNQLISDLKENLLTYEELMKKYDIKITTLSNINNGKIYNRPEEKYPLRKIDKGKTNRRIFSNEELIFVKESLENSDLSMSEIAKILSCDRKVISDINNGNRQYNNLWSYPLRKIKMKTGPKKK